MFVLLFESGLKLTFICDDKVRMFADGIEIGNTSRYFQVSSALVPSNTKILAAMVTNTHGLGAFMASMENGIRTDSSWKCTSILPGNNGRSSSSQYKLSTFCKACMINIFWRKRLVMSLPGLFWHKTTLSLIPFIVIYNPLEIIILKSFFVLIMQLQ